MVDGKAPANAARGMNGQAESVSRNNGGRRLIQAVRNSWNGVRFALRSEAAFRQELAVFVPAVPLAFFITEDAWKRLALIGILMLLFVVELLNTAIEKLSDRVTPAIDPQIGRVKDMGSAAVGLTLLMAGAIWLAAVAERIGWL
jgi:diacylglycerol kinase (ATP)